MITIGITGTLGAGKGTVVEYLIENTGFKHYSVRDFIVEEIRKRNLPVNRDNMVEVANELRRDHHPGYIVEELYNQVARAGKNAVIESIRTEGEINTLRDKQNFYLLAVDADPKLRWRRIRSRGSETDDVSLEKFLANEAREMSSTDPTKQNLQRCIELADYQLENNGTLEELHSKIEEVLNDIEKRRLI